MKYAAFCIIWIALAIAAPFLLLGVPDTATTAGLVGVAAQQTGFALAALLIGSLGLLYRPNRFVGLISGTVIVTLLMIWGAQAG